jgi:CHAD domain-containing protein
MAADTIAHPIGALRELVTSLKAAITLTLAKPKPKPAHQLRTISRRIEAQLELLSLLPDLPEHAKPAKKSRKLLGKLRRAAGHVRDLDVQRDLTESKSKEARHLRRVFKRQRKREADRLLHTIQKHQPKLTLALEALLKALASAESFTLSAPRLVQLTLDWYTHNIPATAEDSDQLHTIRKSAKLARYMAESAIGLSQSTRKLAQTFESLQQSGGEWHDWFTLADIARRELGKSSPLSQSFAQRREQFLTAYRQHLETVPDLLRIF